MGSSVRRAKGFKELRVELPLELWGLMDKWLVDKGDISRTVRRLVRYYMLHLERRFKEDAATLAKDLGGEEWRAMERLVSEEEVK